MQWFSEGGPYTAASASLGNLLKMAGPHPDLPNENLKWYLEMCAVILLGDPSVGYNLRSTDVIGDCENIAILD